MVRRSQNPWLWSLVFGSRCFCLKDDEVTWYWRRRGTLSRCSWEWLAFRKMRSSAAAMMKGGRRAVFCYGQRVCGVRGLSFDEPSPCWWRLSTGECRTAKGPTTRQARMQAYLGQASWQQRCDAAALDSYIGLKICERLHAVPSRAAVEPLVTRERSRRWLERPCLYFHAPVSRCPSPPTNDSPEHLQPVRQKSRHAFAEQPLAGFASTKHRGEMLCLVGFAGLRALVDGKKPRSVV